MVAYVYPLTKFDICTLQNTILGKKTKKHMTANLIKQQISRNNVAQNKVGPSLISQPLRKPREQWP